MLKFFTNSAVENDYLLIQLKDYIKKKDQDPNYFDNYKEVLIDPIVSELRKSDHYSWENKIDIDAFLKSLPINHFFSFDYPSDMNPKNETLFNKKSWENALKYCKYSQYIVTIQSKFQDSKSFEYWFDKYNALEIKSSFMAIGNLCRIFFLTPFVRNIILYSFPRLKHKRIHIYGLALKCIPYAYRLSKKFNIELSIDSTKWTRCVNNKLRYRLGENHRHCTGVEERQLFFNEYLKVINNRINPQKSDYFDKFK